MWKDSAKGIECEFVSKKGEMLTVEIQKNLERAVVKGAIEHVIMGMRENKVRIYNDLYFDESINNLIRTKMGQLFIKKVDPKANKRK
ncbi:MAG TPA: hypothetical protein DCY20_04405 [Firmicutes bacterium]|nr:hypothetical protein [Bacillota bacterium]